MKETQETFSTEWFNAAFTDPTNDKPYEIPANLRRISERICRSYGISGVCDPMYLANIIAFELGLGDGQSSFRQGDDVPEYSVTACSRFHEQSPNREHEPKEGKYETSMADSAH